VSDLVRAEEGANFGKDDGDDGGYNSESSYSSEEERIELTEEQKLEKQMDEENVHIEKVTYSPTHSLNHSLTQSLTHSLTHSGHQRRWDEFPDDWRRG
jgi:hypothetical protein